MIFQVPSTKPVYDSMKKHTHRSNHHSDKTWEDFYPKYTTLTALTLTAVKHKPQTRKKIQPWKICKVFQKNKNSASKRNLLNYTRCYRWNAALQEKLDALQLFKRQCFLRCDQSVGITKITTIYCTSFPGLLDHELKKFSWMFCI